MGAASPVLIQGCVSVVCPRSESLVEITSKNSWSNALSPSLTLGGSSTSFGISCAMASLILGLISLVPP